MTHATHATHTPPADASPRLIAADTLTGVTLGYNPATAGYEVRRPGLALFRFWPVDDDRNSRSAFAAFAAAVECYQDTRAAALDDAIRSEFATLAFD